MTRGLPVRASVAIGVLAAAVSLAAQVQTIPRPLLPTPSPQIPGQLQGQPTFKARVDLIQVDVSVLDKDRRPVHGLAAADFTVFENGIPQPISAFVEMSASDPEGPADTWMRTVVPDVKVNNAEDGRVLLLILDDGRMPFMPAASRGKPVGPDPEVTTKHIAHAIVERLGPADLAAVIFTARNKNEQEFTSDRDRLFAAIDGFDTIEPNYFSEMRARDTFKAAAEFLAEIPDRRKAIIMITPGSPGVYVPGSRVIMNRMGGWVQDALVAALRGNVTFYTISPMMMNDAEAQIGALLDPQAPPATASAAAFARPTSGPPPPPTYTADTHPLPLDQLTGGFTIRGPGQLAEGIQQIFRETGSYYLLGYTNADAKDDGKPRHIEVRVNRPELVVRSRPERFDVNRSADYRFDLPITDLAPGSYLLTFEATMAGAPAVRQDVRFVVRQ